MRFLKAIAIAQSGRLGKNVNAFVAIGGAPKGGPFEDTVAPEDIDWDRWVGPAPEAKYSDNRRRYIRWYFEYSGGKMTDWGAHHIDIAQWALGMSDTGPVSVSGTGKFPPLVPDNFDWQAFLNGDVSLPNGYNTATEFSIDLTFANLKKAFPVMKDVRIDRTWAGLIDVTPDAIPVISPIDEIPGFYLATGFSGHGFGIGPGAGRLVSEMVTDAPTCVDLQPFRYSRFFDGSPLHLGPGV